MATVRTMTGSALTELGVIPLAGQPHVDHLDVGLAGVRTMLSRWVTSGTFGRLMQVYPPPTVLPECAPDLTVWRTTDDDGILLFDQYKNGWWDLEVITLDGEAPLSNRDPDGFACALAMEISSKVAAPVPDDTRRRGMNFTNSLAWKHGFERRCVEYSFS